MSQTLHLLPVFLLVFLNACGGGTGDSSITDSATYSIELAFNRVDNTAGLDPFTVTATVLKDGTPSAGLTCNCNAARIMALTIWVTGVIVLP